MELLSKDILDQIQWAKAQREAAAAAKVEANEEVDENFDPIRDIEVDADPELEGKPLWKASW